MTLKRESNKKLRILVLIALLFFSFIINFQYIFNRNLSKYHPDYYNLKHAQFWGRIHINNNWSATESNFSWCTGSGTWTNPYIIQDLIINSQNSSYGILIENSQEFFKIENCTVYNSGDGYVN